MQSQQTDPNCCGFSQVGGDENREGIHESTTQSASGDDAFQMSTLFGEVHQASEPANSCRIDQQARDNSDSEHATASGTDDECADLFLTTTCTSDAGEGSCTSTESSPCDPYCPEGPASLPPIVILPSLPTFGQPIDMPDYTAEPDDFVDSP